MRSRAGVLVLVAWFGILAVPWVSCGPSKQADSSSRAQPSGQAEPSGQGESSRRARHKKKAAKKKARKKTKRKARRVARKGRPILATGRTFLVAGENEKTGYGLYSYILFGRPPTDESRPQYLKVLEEFLRYEPVEELVGAGFDRADLNVTLLPVDIAKSDPSPGELLEHYDYARSAHLLAQLRRNDVNGIFIVTVDYRLSADPPSGNDPVAWELTREPEEIIGEWVEIFFEALEREYDGLDDRLNVAFLTCRSKMIELGKAIVETDKIVERVERILKRWFGTA